MKPTVSNSRLLVTVALLACGLGCSSTKSAAVVPVGLFQTARTNQTSEQIHDWNAWGDANLRDGDIVFMRGDCYLMMGAFNFSDVSTEIADSRFSHIGLVAIEEGQAFVYDLRSEGCLRTRVGELLAHRQLHQAAIKRHRQVSPEELSRVTDFCRDVFAKQDKYDSDLKLDNARLYCSELVEEAYRTAGYRLSDPIRIQDLPNYGQRPKTMQCVYALTKIEPDQAVLVPGNDQIGIWANPMLDLVLDLPDTKVRPRSTIR